jgi:hypothetical protein
MTVNNLKLHEMQTQMNALAVDAAEKSGSKITGGIKAVSKAVGVDYATMKGFVFGTIKRPSERTVDRVRTFLRDNGDCQSVVEDPRDAKISELETKIRQLHEEIENKDKSREDLRLSYVKVREQLESMQAQDPEFHEQYQVVHPENSYWMAHSDTYIEIYTTGRDWEDSCERNRVCTLPIPDTTMLCQQGQVPHIRVEKDDESFDWIPDPDYVKISESDKGEVWEAPETVTSRGYTRPARSVLVESDEQYAVRRKQVRAENFALIADTAKAIDKMYRKCGGIPDTEVYVGLRVDVIGNVF